MSPAFPAATIEIVRDSEVERWRFQLADDAPLAVKELRAELVDEFIGGSADAENFQLVYAGTAGEPVFRLIEDKKPIISKTRLT